MKMTTVRNLMLSMLVLGAAGSAAGLGTFAQFNASTTSTGNTFSSAAVTFSSTNTGGTCTSTNGATATGTCSTTTTLGTMVPGDSKLGTTILTNGGNVSVKVDLGIVDTANSSAGTALTTNSIGAKANTTAGTYGLGILVFECRLHSTSADAPCTGGSSALDLYTVYGDCGGTNTVISSIGNQLLASLINTTGVTDNGIKVSGTTCYGGNTGAGIHNLSIPIVALSGAPTAGNTSPLATTKTDSLGILVYLPYPANNTLQNITSTNITYTWTATQIAGASS
jgi:hypothetical protein